MLDKLYAQFGQLMLQSEMLNNQIQQVKQQIAMEMQKQLMAEPKQSDSDKK